MILQRSLFFAFFIKADVPAVELHYYVQHTRGLFKKNMRVSRLLSTYGEAADLVRS